MKISKKHEQNSWKIAQNHETVKKGQKWLRN